VPQGLGHLRGTELVLEPCRIAMLYSRYLGDAQHDTSNRTSPGDHQVLVNHASSAQASRKDLRSYKRDIGYVDGQERYCRALASLLL
jgi:hypothetical protein